jgi:hypothetical protein
MKSRSARRVSELISLFVFVVVAASVGWAQGAGTEKQVEVFGQRINYVEAGSGPVVILLHGLGADATNWAATIP